MTLYQSLAGDLRAAIVRGDYLPGAQLPTEHELCDTHGVSRHTAREALRILSEEGLIERRRGAGTIVAPRMRPRPFVQTIGDLGDILQYARDARLNVTGMSRAPAGARERALLGLGDGDWMRIEGLRGDSGRPIAWTRIFIRADICPPRSEIEAFDGALNELIARRSGVTAATIAQSIAAVTLSATDARRLNAAPDAPALRTVRRYLDAGERIFQGSVSLHPGDRFEYEMKLERRRR
jgi:DNA-binding GntR family transcriptional regulator